AAYACPTRRQGLPGPDRPGPCPLLRPALVLEDPAWHRGPHPSPLPVLPRRGPLDHRPRECADLVRDLPRLPRRARARAAVAAAGGPRVSHVRRCAWFRCAPVSHSGVIEATGERPRQIYGHLYILGV